ncbi:MAG: glutathionylspermidine synthase family protein [Verrucomicrobiales bacterium]
MKSSPWPLTPKERQQVLDTLRFDYFKWDINAVGKCLVLPESMVLTQAEHQRVITVVERFANILAKLEREISQDAELLRYLGIPAPVIPLIQAEPEQALQIARYDLFPTDDGRWMVSEFNEDVPGGFNEAIGLPELLGEQLNNGARFQGRLDQAFLQALQPWERVAFMFATGYSEDLQHMLILEKLLKEAGHETELCSPAHLKANWLGQAHIMGRRFDAGFRFYPGEWLPMLANLKDWQKVVARFPVMNPLRRLIRQSKRLFIHWAKPGVLDEDDRNFVEEYAPASVEFDPAHIPQWQAERDDWVLKHAFGRMGDSVVMGCLVDAPAWDQALQEASKTPQDFLMQRCFRNTPLTFATGQLYPAIGAFLINGKFAGYYSRAAEQPFLTHEAYHVTTLVEKAA